jgi:menaquinone-dependent protoporphyrinogen IX oxidase
MSRSINVNKIKIENLKRGRWVTMTATRPRVLFVYFTYSQQTFRVVEVMTDSLRERGCDVQHARIEFADPRYADRFSRFPLGHPYRDIGGMLAPQLRHVTGQIRVPDTAREGNYDLVCIASPTWWLNPCMPIRSFMESDLAGTVLAGKRFAAIVVCHRYWKSNLATLKALGTKKGGKFVSGVHFIAAGGPIGSMLALMGYLATGASQARYLGMKLPLPNLQPSYVAEAQAFAGGLADSLGCVGQS